MGGRSLRRTALVAVVAITVLSLGWASGAFLSRGGAPGAIASGLLSSPGTAVLATRGPTKVTNPGSLAPRSDLNLALLLVAVLVAASVARRRPDWSRSAASGAAPSLLRRRHTIALRAPPTVRHL